MADKEKDFFSKYFNAVIEDFETIRNLSVIGQKKALSLEKITIPLDLSEKTGEQEIPTKRDRDVNPEISGEKQREMEYRSGSPERKGRVLDVDTAVRNHPWLVVVGPPGSGKTTMLKYLTLKICKENINKQEKIKIPIPVRLREFVQGTNSLRDYINDVFEKFGFPKAKKFIEKDLGQGKCMLLLDGFDELIGRKTQSKVSQEIHRFIKKYDRCRVLVTSRFAASLEDLQDFTRLEILEFNNNQIKRFITNWFGPSDKVKANVLLNLLMNNKDLEAFAKNPLMISIIAILIDTDYELLYKRSDLYKRMIDIMLGEWDAQKKIRNHFSLRTKKLILRKIAFRNHSRQRRTMTEKEILEEIERHSFWIGYEKEKSRLLLEEISQRSYILRQLFKDTYDFLHIFFQEYFTALELIEQEDGNDIIQLHLSDPWWEKVILLYAGMKRDVSPLINIIRKEKPEDIFHSNLMLAGKCIAEAEYTDLFLKDGVTQEIWHLYNTSDFQLLKERAIAVLARLKPRHIIDELVNQLTDEDHQVRRWAAETLGLIGSSEVLPALIMILAKDSESKIRSYAASALGKIRNTEAVRPLINVLNVDKENEVRKSAADALGLIGSSEALPALIKTLTMDHDSNVRGGAAEAIGEIGSTEPIPQLIQALSTEKESSVRWRTAMALGKLQGTDAHDLLIEALMNDKDKEVRESAAESLGQIGSAECISALIKALSYDNDADVRGSAAYALGLIRSKEATPSLIRALITDTNGEVRGRAAYALGRIKQTEAIPYLIAVFNTHKESIIRGNAAYALGEIGGVESIPFLIQALTLDKDSYVRYRAAEVLGSIGNVITIQPLKIALEDEGSYYGWRVKDKALEALEKISRRFHVRITWTANKGE